MSKIGAPLNLGNAIDSDAHGGGALTVLGGVVVLVIASITLAVLLREQGGMFLLALLGVFSVIGVFALFAGAFGLLHFGVRAPTYDLAATYAANAPEGILITTDDGSVIFSNQAYRRIAGLGEDGVPPGLEQAFAGQPGSAEPVFRLVRAARRGKAWREDFECSAPGSASRQLRVSVRALPYRGQWRDRSTLRVWEIQDISDDRRRELALKRKLDQLLGYWEDAQVGFIAADEEGRVRYLNKRLAGWLDVEAGAEGELRLTDVIAANGASLLVHGGGGEIEAGEDDASADLAASPGPAPHDLKTLDLEMIRHDGGALPVRFCYWTQEQNEDDRPLLCAVVLNRLSVSSDDAESQVFKARLASFFNAAPIAVATLTREAKLLSCNGAFLAMFPFPKHEPAPSGSRPNLRFLGKGGVKSGGQSAASGAAKAAAKFAAKAALSKGEFAPPPLPANVRNTPLYDLIDEVSRDRLGEAIDKAIARKAGIPPVDVTLVGDSKRTARLYVCQAPDADPDQDAAVVYGIDASELRALEEQIAQSQKMQAIGQLAGGVAHDFNNVLTAIIGFSDLLLSNHRPSDPAFNDIMAIKQNANRAAGLVRQLLAFSRRQTLRPQVLSLTAVLEDLTVLLGRLLGEKVSSKVVHGRDLWLIKADLNQLEQVIINLAVNARDAMPEGGQLTIRTANVSERDSLSIAQKEMEPGEYVLCEVSDTGTGIPPELIEKIFEPFFSTKEVGKGTGLGLSTVYGIVKQTGGYIFVDTDPGKGAAFRIYLPRHVEAEKAPEAAVAKPEKKERTKDLTGTGTVLLVEDEEAVRSFAARALATRGYRVLEAGSGVQALEVMEREGGAVDLVVSDVVMPEMDGPTLLKRLRERNPELKIIFISGYAEEAFKNNLDAREKFSFLPKPFSLKKLAAAVKDALDGGEG
jgi:two-component system, cell cycle sensor histidine kinase and response regulator CckA